MTEQEQQQIVLPDEGMYELRIVSAELAAGKFGPQIALRFAVLGTQNEKTRDENGLCAPHLVRTWLPYSPKAFTYSKLTIVDGEYKQAMTKGDLQAKLLDKLRIEPPKGAVGADLVVPQLLDCYAQAFLSHKTNEKGKFLQMDVKNPLTPVTNKEHITFNQSKVGLLFPTAPVAA